MNPKLGWHFVGKTIRGGSPIPKDGVLLRYNDDVKLGKTGLHACRRVTDAIRYSEPSALTLCRVELHDVVEEEFGAMVGRGRKILWRIDASKLLMEAVESLDKVFYDKYKHQGPSLMKIKMEFFHTDEEELLQELIKKHR